MSAVRRFARRAACSIGADHAGRWANRGRLLIACYHGLREDHDPTRHWLLVPRREFRAQMEYLATHYRCLPLDEAIVELREDRLRGPVACVTFDDGYVSNHTLARPILEALGIPATVYVATGLVSRHEFLWTTQLEYTLRTARRTTIAVPEAGIPWLRVGDEGARASARALCEHLKAVGVQRRREVIAAIEAQVPRGTPPTAFQLMRWDDIRAMTASGTVRVGAHTVNHEILSRLSDHDLVREIADSVAEVAQHVATPATSFAYPNGLPADYDHRARAAVAGTACRAAVTAVEGLNDAETDPYELRRVLVGGFDSFDAFRLRVAGLGRAAGVPL